MRQLHIEVHRRDHHVWMVVVGRLDHSDMERLVERIEAFGGDPWIRRLSVDATCAVCADAAAAALLETLRTSGPSWLDVTTAGVLSRVSVYRPAA